MKINTIAKKRILKEKKVKDKGINENESLTISENEKRVL